MYRLTFGLFLITCLASAKDIPSVAANASGSGHFRLDDQDMPSNTGVTSWPLVADDKITTSSTPLSVLLNNGTEVIVQPNSEVKIGVSHGETEIIVLRGSVITEPISLANDDHDGHHHHDGDDDHDHPRHISHHRCHDGDDDHHKYCWDW